LPLPLLLLKHDERLDLLHRRIVQIDTAIVGRCQKVLHDLSVESRSIWILTGATLRLNVPKHVGLVLQCGELGLLG
jgi:hypothetical protein